MMRALLAFAALGVGCSSTPTPQATSTTSPPGQATSSPPAPATSSTSHSAGGVEPKIVDVATRVPEVGAMCRDADAAGATCTVWIERAGAETCPPGSHPTDACTWEVYVGSNMGSHVSRLATIWVDPGRLAPTAAADLACPPMTLAGFAKKVAASRAGHPIDECPDEIEH